MLLTNDQLELKSFGANGITKVRFTLYNNLRNLLGPHHRQEGELYAVDPASFFKEPCVWTMKKEIPWNDDYCFVEMGL